MYIANPVLRALMDLLVVVMGLGYLISLIVVIYLFVRWLIAAVQSAELCPDAFITSERRREAGSKGKTLAIALAVHGVFATPLVIGLIEFFANPFP